MNTNQPSRTSCPALGNRSARLRTVVCALLLNATAVSLVTALALCATAGGASAADNSIWGDPRKLPIPPLGPIPVPSPERFVLSNGMVIYLLEDHEFPLVDVRALMRAGSIYEPKEKVGLASVVSEVMRTGGSTSISGDSLDRKLESLGASVEISIEATEGRATVSTLNTDIAEGLSILADLLRHPAFPEDKIDLAKKQERTAIASRNDEPMQIVFREFPKLIYGADHPYGRQTEYATIEAITREDLIRFHEEFIQPDRMILSVYGDFETARIKPLLSKIFTSWAKSTKPLPPDPVVSPKSPSGVYLANKPDATNSIVVLGQVGIRIDDPDFPALAVLNQVIGGGFSSRLMNEIRTKRGLAYATGASPGAEFHHPGAMFYYAATQTDSTAVTTGYVLHEVEKAISEPVSQEEVDRARDAILNSLVQTLSSKGAVLNRMATYEFYGYPRDFLQTFQENIRKVTPADLQSAGTRRIHPKDFATVIVGNESRIVPAMTVLGPYQKIDISIPEPGGDIVMPAATEADFQQGQKLLAAAVEACGGVALQSLKDFTYEEKGSLSIQGMNLPVTGKKVKKMPDCERSEQVLPFGTVLQSICGDKGWMQSPKGIQEIPPEAMSEAKTGQVRDLFNVLLNGKTLKIQAVPGDVDVDGRPALAALVQSDLVKGWKLYFDKETHRIARMEYRERHPATGEPGLATETYSDYRAVGGVQWPYAHSTAFDGAPFATMTVTTASANTGIDPTIFVMPSK
jgi:zinc protease